MKITSVAIALVFGLANTGVFAQDDVEIDFIQGSDYVHVGSSGEFINKYARSTFVSDELEVDHISGSEYVEMQAAMVDRGQLSVRGRR
ncbi:MAG: hypothetical protein OEZ47_11050 [Gammaproteobacteria bacterium]|nr:hypothetical protein [Gammaproteobacteria bacterium]